MDDEDSGEEDEMKGEENEEDEGEDDGGESFRLDGDGDDEEGEDEELSPATSSASKLGGGVGGRPPLSPSAQTGAASSALSVAAGSSPTSASASPSPTGSSSFPVVDSSQPRLSRPCRPADWRCFLGCGKAYKKSSGRSIRRHALQCYRRHFPAECAGRTDAQVHDLLAARQEEGRVQTGLRAWRLRQSRRAAHELPAHERWECPNGCGQCYRSTSSRSIERHLDSCTHKGGGEGQGGRGGRAGADEAMAPKAEGGEEGRPRGSFAFPSSAESMRPSSSVDARGLAAALAAASASSAASYALAQSQSLPLNASSLSSFLPPLSLLPSSLAPSLYLPQHSGLSSFPLLPSSYPPSLQLQSHNVSDLLAALSYGASLQGGPSNSHSLPLAPSLSHPQPLPLSLSPFLYSSAQSTSPLQLFGGPTAAALSPSVFPSTAAGGLFSPPLRPLPTNALSAPHPFLVLNSSASASAASLPFYRPSPPAGFAPAPPLASSSSGVLDSLSAAAFLSGPSSLQLLDGSSLSGLSAPLLSSSLSASASLSASLLSSSPLSLPSAFAAPHAPLPSSSSLLPQSLHSQGGAPMLLTASSPSLSSQSASASVTLPSASLWPLWLSLASQQSGSLGVAPQVLPSLAATAAHSSHSGHSHSPATEPQN